MPEVPAIAVIMLTVGAYVLGFLTPVGQSFLADWLTDWRHRRETRTEANRRFADIQRAMPNLIRELREHFGEFEDARELVVLHDQTVIYQNGPQIFRCYRNRHSGLDDHLARLADAGYLRVVNRVTTSPIYRMTDDFVGFLR